MSAITVDQVETDFVYVTVREGRAARTARLSWNELRAASQQEAPDLRVVYGDVLAQAERMRVERDRTEERRAAECAWYALVTFGSPGRGYEVERIGQGVEHRARLIRAGQEMIGTGGPCAVTTARVLQCETEAIARNADISCSQPGEFCVWSS